MNPSQKSEIARKQRALEVDADRIPELITRADEKNYVVSSLTSKDNGPYVVEVENGEAIGCSCQDFFFTKRSCKHVYLLLRYDPSLSLPTDSGNIHFEHSGIQTAEDQIISESSDEWLVQYEIDQMDESLPLTSLFFMHKTSMDLLRRYSYVLTIDSTYKTNMYKMPLVDIIGVTALNRLFFVGLCFVRSESTTSFLFPLRQVKTLYDRLQLSYSGAVFTDKDDGLRRALRMTFPHTSTLLCNWHINNYVKSSFSQAFRIEIGQEVEQRMEELRGKCVVLAKIDD